MEDSSFEWLLPSLLPSNMDNFSMGYNGGRKDEADLATLTMVASPIAPIVSGSQIAIIGTTNDDNAKNTATFKCILTAKSATTISDSSFASPRSGGVSRTVEYNILGGGGGGGADPTEVTVSAVSSAVSETDGSFTVDVGVSSDAPFAAVQAQLSYDPDLVLYTGANANGQKFEVTQATGTISVSDYNLSGGPASLGSLTFKIKDNLTITEDTDVVFTIDSVVYAVTGNTLDNIGAPGANLIVTTLEKPVEPTYPVTFITDSKLAPTGYKVLVYTPDGAIGATDSYTYNGNTLFYAKGLDAFVYIVADTVTAEQASGVIVAGGTRTVANGNVNGNAVVNIVDAQIAFDLSSGEYDAELTTLTIENRLNADVNGDGQITTADAQAIQWAIHHNGEFPA
jgi:hypothetical protein